MFPVGRWLPKICVSQEGFGLLEAIIGAAAVATSSLVISEMMAQQDKSTVSSQVLSTRDHLKSTIDHYILESSVFTLSAQYAGANSAGNLAFNYCYLGSPASGPACAPNCCVQTTLNQPQPFQLFDPATPSQALTGTEESHIYSGQDTNPAPARFDKFGNACPAGSSASVTCPIEVVSSYIADCGGASPCLKASTVSLVYTIRSAVPSMNFKPITKRLFNIQRPDSASSSDLHLAQGAGSGQTHSCALVNGGVYCWGDNTFGQLGQTGIPGSVTPVVVTGLASGVTALSIGYNHNCAIHNGNVKCWGQNTYGQLGTGGAKAPKEETPILVRDNFGTALNNVQVVSAGNTHSCAISNGAAFCWGGNTHGQLGFAEPAPGPQPGPSAGVPQFNGVESWGTNYAVPVLDLTSGVTAISPGLASTCAIQNGTVKCWGINNNWGVRVLGRDPDAFYMSFPFTVVYDAFGVVTDNINRVNTRPDYVWKDATRANAFPGGATAVSMGEVHTCVAVNGSAQCWGANDGKLGDGTVPGRNFPVAMLGAESGVTTFSTHTWGTCVIINGGMKCTGSNSYGILGDNSGDLSSTTLRQVVGLAAGVAPQISGRGEFNVCAVKDSEVYCWGRNDYGQLGDGTYTDSPIPVKVVGFP